MSPSIPKPPQPPLPAVTIRRAGPEDADAISALLLPLLPLITLDPGGAGAEKFCATMRPPAIAAILADERYVYQMGWVEGELAGVVAMRDHSHLYHLFVAQAWQGRGLARRLWQAATSVAAPLNRDGVYTVNASPFALEMYRHLGFLAVGPGAQHDGIAYQPMRLAPARQAPDTSQAQPGAGRQQGEGG